MSDLVALLREDAAAFAKATQMMADAKSTRNQSAGDHGAYYSGLTPQQTRAWQAADEIERLRGEVEYLGRERDEWRARALATLET